MKIFRSNRVLFSWLVAGGCILLVILFSVTLLESRKEAPPRDFYVASSLKCRRHSLTNPDEIKSRLLEVVYNGTESPFQVPYFAGSLVTNLVGPAFFGASDKVYEDLMRQVMPRVVIEIGTFFGGSLIHMATFAQQQLGMRPLFISVDDFRGYPGMFTLRGEAPQHEMQLYQFKKNVLDAKLSDTVVPLPFSSSLALRLLCDLGVKADLIHIDAGHDFLSIWSDVNLAWKLLKPHGVMFGHDYTRCPEIVAAVDLFAKLHNFQVKVNGDHWVYKA